MATNATTHDGKRRPVPGTFFGTDGAGFEHYYEMASRTMTMVDREAGKRRQFTIPESETPGDRPLIDWAIHTVKQHGAAWETIKVDQPERAWLQGDVPVGDDPAEVASDE